MDAMGHEIGGSFRNESEKRFTGLQVALAEAEAW